LRLPRKQLLKLGPRDFFAKVHRAVFGDDRVALAEKREDAAKKEARAVAELEGAPERRLGLAEPALNTPRKYVYEIMT
jgi:hypothetical protein